MVAGAGDGIIGHRAIESDMLCFRLRLTDVKAEHYERKVATVESERDMWEKKYEECNDKFKQCQEELDKICQQLNDM